MPQSQAEYSNDYLNGIRKDHICWPFLEEYITVLDLAGEKILDFVIISNEEKINASNKMFDLIYKWNKDTAFYNSLRINSYDDLYGIDFDNIFGLLNDKTEDSLRTLLIEEKLAVQFSSHELVCLQEVGKAYMSVIAEEIKNRRNLRIVTDDEFYLASKSGMDQVKSSSGDDYQLISMVIPQIYLDPKIINNLTFEQIIRIRKDIKPLASNYYKDLEDYQTRINQLVINKNDQGALDLYCEFCERVCVSFLTFSKEVSKILRIANYPAILGFINGIVLPSIKILNSDPNFQRYCDYASIAVTASSYTLNRKNQIGFEYLECLNRSIRIEDLKGTMTSIIPKSINKVLNVV